MIKWSVVVAQIRECFLPLDKLLCLIVVILLVIIITVIINDIIVWLKLGLFYLQLYSLISSLSSETIK